jgi:hypothetical protein
MTEVIEIILFGKKPCIATRLEEKKKCRSVRETNKGYQIWHDTNTVLVSSVQYLSVSSI